ncbi:hypothetical protein EP342_02920 [bacterium]|nr:MAG: hypothetical protein EP342_02920 [bacterium]
MLNNEQKKKIAEELDKRIKGLTCPMCHNKHFIIADGYFNNNMQDDFKNINLGGPSIPTISIICSNCGFVSQHALGVLNLLPINENDEPGK